MSRTERLFCASIILFSGNTSENEQAYSWEVTLDYDYSEANEQSNLAYTVKRVSVAIMKA